MEKISQRTKQIIKDKRLGLMTHVVIGYPNLKGTERMVLAMEKVGADFIELQIPFSDPLADGPTIMEANQIALTNKIGMEDCLQLMKRLSGKVRIPLLFMSYYNPISNFGVEKFCKEASRVGAKGLIVPDMPIEEEKNEKFYYYSKKYNLNNILVVSPATTNERLKKISDVASGFIYCMARYGITGDKKGLDNNLDQYLGRVRKYIKLSLAVGFGISKKEYLEALENKANIAVIGSKLINVYNRRNRVGDVGKYLENLIK